ncbi:helix-turn-helix transcriptional regulator [Sporosarcina sp. E16_3]|uniref:AraC family transcriptional regulator n=1 Tax=Sporosarcina sp. E16_3 TaxID=2789293 RepID=UPI001A90FC2C|nr:AraC family transcriptional regulator [Sporosarcina sp. E16_3]MBO0600621.1 helix-turn-helix transcriptional regulator [Sporosarcina sp. E16_3]
MLSNFRSIKYGIYGFHFKESNQQRRIAGIHSLGLEKQMSTSYDWDGQFRTEKDVIVFQYTLKGAGEIRINDCLYRLGIGDAFFVRIPGNHRYYLPADSPEWEFVHLTLFGEEAIRCYNAITDNIGHILKLDIYSTPITHIFELINRVSTNQINDAYEASALSYSFLMELQRYILNFKSNIEIPESISKAIHFVNNNYAEPITLDDIVQSSGVSKYHFTRTFHEKTHVTPIQHLTNIRIKKSIELLKNNNLTIEDIALQVGFSNGNYFTKVFRASLGLPPGKYRNSKSFIPIDHLIFD